MIEELVDFLRTLFEKEKVGLAYSDAVTKPGLGVVYYDTGIDAQKELDGTTNLLVGNFIFEIWHDTYAQVLEASNTLFTAAEGTKFQIQNMRSVRINGSKKKWHREISIIIMEDV